MEFGREPASSC